LLQPGALAVPDMINYCWSMDLMHHQLQNGRSVPLQKILIGVLLYTGLTKDEVQETISYKYNNA